ncbi:uncharacterized protein LOC143057712 isoform X2 [Mytilus galloprovincialis]|uniref:uncharacterized protein LOC143057712 isoform X2 n=1 Tax=Mytilus galloprovincialis TaxID=29158 RepID=UPI003F7B69A1
MAEVDSNVPETEVNGISETYLDVQSTNQNNNEVNINKMVGKSESEISEIEENVMIETSTSLLETFTNFVTVPFAQLLKQKTNATTEMSDSTEEAKVVNGISDSTEEANAMNGISDSANGSEAMNCISDLTEEANGINGKSDSTEEENAITGITDSTSEAKDKNGTLDSTEEENAINSKSDSKNETNDINGTLDSTLEAVSINGTSAPKLEDETSAENDTSAMFSKKELTAVTETLPSLIEEKSPTVTNSSDHQIKEEATIETKTLTSLINEDTTTSVNETSLPLLEKANIIADTSSPLFEKDASAKTETPIPLICEELNVISHTSGSLSEEEETMTETSAPLSKDETNAVNKSPQLLEIASSTNEISDKNLEKKMSAELLLEETTAITEEEANAIRETWTVLWSNKKENGIALLIKLFTTYPEAQKMFPMFDGLTIEEVRSSKKLRAHALSLMYALKSFLDNLDDSDTLDGLVRKNAINHAKRGVGAKELMWLLPLFLELLDEIMEDSVTELHKKAWTKIYGVLASISREEVNNLIVKWAQLLPEGTTSMTEEDALALNESWAVVWSDKKKNGKTLFIKLFTTHPEAQKMFKDFDGLTIEEMKSSKKLEAHGLSFMYALKSFLDNLDDPDTLEGLVRKNAINHAVRGVGPKEIMLLLPLFLEQLDETTEDNVTELEKKAWAKLYVVLASISREEVNNLSAQLLPEEPSSITEDEANIISETWTVVWSDKKKNGIALFVKYDILKI